MSASNAATQPAADTVCGLRTPARTNSYMQEVEVDLTLKNPDVVTKYKTAAEITNRKQPFFFPFLFLPLGVRF